MKRNGQAPIKTYTLQFFYNPFQVMLNSYLVVETITLLIRHVKKPLLHTTL